MAAPLQQARKLRAAGDLERATHVPEAAVRDDSPERVELRELADVRARRGLLQRAHEALDQAAALLANRDDEEAQRQTDAIKALLADAHNTLGGIAWQEGRIDDAISEIGRSITLYDIAQHRVGAAHSRLNLGVLCFCRGDWQRARRYLTQSRRIRVGLGHQQGLAANLLNLGLLEIASGKLTQARQYLEESESTSRTVGEEHDRVLADIALAHLDILEHRIDDAGTRLDAVLRLRQSLTDDAHVQALWLKALVDNARGESERAVMLAREARRRAYASQIVESESDACRALATIYRAEKRLSDNCFAWNNADPLLSDARVRRALDESGWRDTNEDGVRDRGGKIEARRASDLAARRGFYHRFHALLAADQPYTWTIQVGRKWAINQRVHNVQTSQGFALFLWNPGPLGWGVR